MSKYTILVVDDNKSILTAVRMLLEHTFERVITTPTPHSILHTLESEAVDVVLLDMNFSAGLNTGNEGLFHLREIKKHFPKIPVVLFTAYADIELAVNGIKEGAADFVVKPWDNDKLVATLRNVCESGREEMQENKAALSRMTGLFWGGSPAMRDIRSLVEKIARTEASVLISGENGTGKSLLASEIHRLSLCASKPLVTVDLGAISESLFESELFGHEKGAFTGAHQRQIGRFEAADHGTIFLDEISEISPAMQMKLLRALETRTVTRLGGNEAIKTDIRIVAATNRDLEQYVAEGKFREDLYYRLNVVDVHDKVFGISEILGTAEGGAEGSAHHVREFALELGISLRVKVAHNAKLTDARPDFGLGIADALPNVFNRNFLQFIQLAGDIFSCVQHNASIRAF